MSLATIFKNYLSFFSFFDGHFVHSRDFMPVAVDNVQHELCTGCTFRAFILKNAVPNICVDLFYCLSF